MNRNYNNFAENKTCSSSCKPLHTALYPLHITVFSFSEYVFTGKPFSQKVEEIREKLKEKDVCAVVVAALDEVACDFTSEIIRSS